MHPSRYDVLFNTDTGRLVRRDPAKIPRIVGDFYFLPVLDFWTDEPSEPRFDLLRPCADMEIIALAARSGEVGDCNGC